MSRNSNPSKITRRQFLTAAGAAGAGLALGEGLGGRPAFAAKELRILFAGGTWQEWYNKTFVEAFVKDSGAQIVWKTGLHFVPLVIAQRNRPQWDLIHQNQNTSGQLDALNVAIEWKESDIPNLKDIHPAFRYRTLAGKIHTPYGMAVNTKRIKRPITKWADMWDPALKGKIGFPAWDWVGDEVFYAMNQIFGGSMDDVNPGMEKLKGLYHDNKAITANNVEHTQQLLVAEEIWITPYFGARTEKAAAAGAPVEFVIPEEGGLSWIWNTSILANRPAETTKLALNLVNTTLDPGKQIAFCRLTGYPPTNIKAMNNLPKDLQKLKFSDKQLEAFGKIQRKFDYMAMFAQRDSVKERWNKTVLAG